MELEKSSKAVTNSGKAAEVPGACEVGYTFRGLALQSLQSYNGAWRGLALPRIS